MSDRHVQLRRRIQLTFADLRGVQVFFDAIVAHVVTINIAQMFLGKEAVALNIFE